MELTFTAEGTDGHPNTLSLRGLDYGSYYRSNGVGCMPALTAEAGSRCLTPPAAMFRVATNPEHIYCVAAPCALAGPGTKMRQQEAEVYASWLNLRRVRALPCRC